MDKLAIPCQCGCSVVVMVEFDKLDAHPQEFFAEFYTMVCPSFWQRLSTAWKVFRGKEHWLHDVVMDPEALKELQGFLNNALPVTSTDLEKSAILGVCHDIESA